MGCNCKSKKKSVVTEPIKSGGMNIFLKKLKLLGMFIMLLTIMTLMLPIIWGVLMIMVYKNVYGNGFDLVSFTKTLMGKNKVETPKEEEEDIDPNDYEAIGIDEIKNKD